MIEHVKIIGLTGGIGSGKSTVAKMFKSMGIPVYDSDKEAKLLMNNSDEIKRELIACFGDDSFKDGKLNRKYLAAVVFNDKTQLKKINQIVHPKVEAHFKQWALNQDKNVVIQENAILFESGKENFYDLIISVTAPEEIRIERVILRDQITKEQVKSRIKNQTNDKIRLEKSDFIIENIDLEKTQLQVNQVVEMLNKL